VITASIASAKGLNAPAWFIFGALLFFLALPLVLISKRK
jgi:hypothetical protein